MPWTLRPANRFPSIRLTARRVISRLRRRLATASHEDHCQGVEADFGVCGFHRVSQYVRRVPRLNFDRPCRGTASREVSVSAFMTGPRDQSFRHENVRKWAYPGPLIVRCFFRCCSVIVDFQNVQPLIDGASIFTARRAAALTLPLLDRGTRLSPVLDHHSVVNRPRRVDATVPDRRSCSRTRRGRRHRGYSLLLDDSCSPCGCRWRNRRPARRIRSSRRPLHSE